MPVATGRLVGVLVLVARLLHGQAAEPPAARYPGSLPDSREYRPLRWMEDWSFLRFPSKDAANDTDAWDALKYIPLGANSKASLSIGGEIRLMGESYVNPFWGAEPDDASGYLLQRYMLHADLKINSRVRLFGQLQSGLAVARTDGPRPAIDSDRVDVHQAFLDFRLPGEGDRAPTLRLVRQELNFGSGRLVATREGLNLRQSFDGVRLSLRLASWHVDALGVRPARNKFGAFNNSPDNERIFWGVYGWTPVNKAGSAGFDVYYFGLDRKRWAYQSAMGRELRHTVGGRWWTRPGSWDIDYEGIFQFGSMAGKQIRAWSLASTTGRTFPSLPLKPRIGIRADVSSGDKDSSDSHLGTFNPLFAKGNYFGEAELLGPLNLIDIHPTLVVWPHPKLRLIGEFVAFWRHSTRDGIYTFAQVLSRPGLLSTARHVANSFEIDADWEITRHLAAKGTWQRVWAGSFLKETLPARTLNFGMLAVTYKF